MGQLKIKVDDELEFPMYVGDRVADYFQEHGEFEPASLRVWKDMCSRGGIAVDVGAYTGIFTIIAAKMGCTVHAIEPMPFNFVRLGENVHLNKLDNVRLYERVASDFDGDTQISFNPAVKFTAGASITRTGDQSRRNLPVRAMRIDSLGLHNVRAIKIDVEKAEAFVLRGAVDTIARNMPRLLIEALKPKLEKEIVRLLPKYRVVERIDRRNLVMVPR